MLQFYHILPLPSIKPITQWTKEEKRLIIIEPRNHQSMALNVFTEIKNSISCRLVSLGCPCQPTSQQHLSPCIATRAPFNHRLSGGTLTGVPRLLLFLLPLLLLLLPIIQISERCSFDFHLLPPSPVHRRNTSIISHTDTTGRRRTVAVPVNSIIPGTTVT